MRPVMAAASGARQACRAAAHAARRALSPARTRCSSNDRPPPRRALHRQCHRRRHRRRRRRLPRRRGADQGLDAADRRRGGGAALFDTWARRARSAAARPANTAAGVAALGGRAGFIGQVAPDQLGEFYRHDIRAAGVEFTTAARADFGMPTARSLILVTPDAHRTMNTFLGAAQHLPARRSTRRRSRGAAILYLEGYLWDPETPRSAMVRAIEVAREAGRKVAFTLSDSFCIDRHRDGFNALIDERPDRHPVRQRGRDPGAGRRGRISRRRSRRSRPRCETLVVTRSEKGALAIARRRARRGPGRAGRARWSTRPAPATCSRRASSPAEAQGRGLEQSLKLGAIAAAEVISALRRAARGGPQGAGRRARSHKKRAAPKDRPFPFRIACGQGRMTGLPSRPSGASSGK